MSTLQAHIVNVLRRFQADRIGAVCKSTAVFGGVQAGRVAAEVGEGVDEARPGRGAAAEEGAEGQGQRQGEEQASYSSFECQHHTEDFGAQSFSVITQPSPRLS